MHPTIRDGEVIFVGPVTGESLERGRVILARNGNRLVVHRVVSVMCDEGGELRIRTRGDNHLHRDPVVRRDDIIGAVVAIDRRGKRGMRRGYPLLLTWFRNRLRAGRAFLAAALSYA
jgi:signal peptidase I